MISEFLNSNRWLPCSAPERIINWLYAHLLFLFHIILLKYSLVCSFLRTRLVLLGEKSPELACLHHSLSGEAQWQHDFPEVILIKVMSAMLLHCKVTIFPFPYFILWEWVTKSSLRFRWGELSSTSWSGEFIYIYYLEFFCKEDFLYLFIHSNTLATWCEELSH